MIVCAIAVKNSTEHLTTTHEFETSSPHQALDLMLEIYPEYCELIQNQEAYLDWTEL